jgi:hypothetical protein
LDIGEDGINIGTRFQDSYGLVGIGCLEDFEACASDRLGRIQPQQDHQAQTRHYTSSARAKRVGDVLFLSLGRCPDAQRWIGAPPGRLNGGCRIRATEEGGRRPLKLLL